MRKLNALEALAQLAVAATTDRDGALSEATRIVGAATGSDDVRLFAGDGVSFDGYPRRDGEDFFGLSPDGLMSASQELRRLGRAAVYTVGRDRRPHNVAPTDGTQAGNYVAFSLWTGHAYSGEVVARGPWTGAAARRAGRFLEAAGPALAIMLDLVVDAARTDRLQQQMNVLADVARVFTRAERMREVLGEVVSAINSATGFLSSLDLLDTRGRIAMRSTAASRFTGTPLYEAWLGLTRAPDPVRKMIVENHQLVLLPDLQNDPRISEEAREFYRRASLVSAATFPLLFQDEVVGLLRVGSLKPTSFDPPTVDLLRNLALQAAVVVKGVQLWEELKRSRTKIERYATNIESRNQELLNEISERRRAEEALRESEEKFRRIFDNVYDTYYRTDAQGIITEISPSVERYGYTPEELIGTQVLNVYENQEERSGLLEAVFQRGQVIDYELHLKAAGGRQVPMSISARLLRDADGTFAGTEGILRDISERKQAAQALARQSALVQAMNRVFQEALTSESEEAVARTCLAVAEQLTGSKFGFIGEVNQAGRFDTFALSDPGWQACRIPGSDATAAIRDMEIRGIWGSVIKQGRSLRANDPSSHPDRVGTPDGHPPLAAFLGVPLKLGRETIGMIAVANKESGYDLADQEDLESLSVTFVEALMRKRAEAALREQVRRDALTGVLNHGAIVDELGTLIYRREDGSSHGVAMIDVDGLKTINDTYGHQVGDAVLRAVAGALSRDGALLGRYGGDEFVALLPGADRGAAERYRQGALAALADVDLRDPETGARVTIVVSVGLAIYPTEAGRIEDLIKLADGAMYAWRRQRPVVPAGRSLSRPLGGDRAAEMMGQIVPLLTSPGDLNDKLRLVAHRLSVGAGYDAVSFQLFNDPSEAPTGQNTFAKVAEEIVEAWNRAQRHARDVPMRRILERTHRPIIVDDPQHDRRLTGGQRELLRAAGLRSALVAPMIWQNELIGHAAVASRRKGAVGPRDAEFLMAVATQVTAIVRLATLVEELQSTSTSLVQAQTETVLMLAAAAEAHDHATGLHLHNVRAITRALASELGRSEENASELGLAAVLHDIGKIRVPDIVLSTAGQLADEEWELMKQHTVWGEEFLAGRPGFELAAAIARSHHERWDGGGYPDGLVGEAIPEVATIVAVADAFDAMTSDRPYKAARSVAAAVREITTCSGGQFGPRVVQALVRLHSRKRIPRLHRERSDKLAA